LRRIVDVSDLPGKQILLSLGASLIGNTLLCSEVHNQTYLPQDSTLVMRPPGDLRSSSQTTMISGGRLPQGCGHAE
jgi:hypothetical protein